MGTKRQKNIKREDGLRRGRGHKLLEREGPLGNDFRRLLKDALEDQGITQAEFASRLDISEGRASQILNEGNPTTGTMERAFKAAGIKAEIIRKK